MEQHYQRFKIDDHLKRHDKALLNLSLAGKKLPSLLVCTVSERLSRSGPERFQEAIEYTERHQLYDSALSIWKDSDHYEVLFLHATYCTQLNLHVIIKDVLTIYGDWLYERRDFREAALG